jgi:hypothetical protein
MKNLIQEIKDTYKALKLVTIVKKTSHTRFITAYTKHGGRINGILISKGVFRSTIRRPKLGDYTVWNTNIDFVRHEKITSKQYI